MATKSERLPSISGSLDADLILLRFRELLQEAFQRAASSGVKRPVGFILLADGGNETAMDLVRALVPEPGLGETLKSTKHFVGCLEYRDIAGALRRVSPRDNDALMDTYVGDPDAWNVVIMFGSLVFIGPVRRTSLLRAEAAKVRAAAIASGELASDIMLSEVEPGGHRKTREWVAGANPKAGKGWMCMHRYLPSPLPEGWRVEMHRADGSVMLDADGFNLILSGIRQGAQRLVHVSLGKDDHHTTDAEANAILNRLQRVRRFREAPVPALARDMPPARNYLGEVD